MSQEIMIVKSTSGGAGAAATVTLAATAGKQWLVHWIAGGYDTAPTGGALVSTGLLDDQLAIPVTAAGPLPHQLPRPIAGSMGGAVTIGLAAGGGAVLADISIGVTSRRIS